MLYKRPNFTSVWVVSAIILLLIGVFSVITWRPYFQNVSMEQILKFSQEQPDPTGSVPSPFKHADSRILSPSTQTLLKIGNGMYLLQIVFALIIFFYIYLGAVSTRSSISSNTTIIQVVILSGSFVGLAYAFATWLGGADWLGNQRPDQTVQFLPLFLLFIFLLPFSFARNETTKIVYGISNIVLAIFVTVNLAGGFFVLRDHLQYRGNVLTEADVPLVHKMQVVDFIAQDWEQHSDSSVIAVDYKLGGGKWDWVPEFGEKLKKWYPAPMTQGRSFDYDLLRRYGLSNVQEGTQLRSFGTGRYLVTYSFEDSPTVEQGQIAHHIFGRLRVSVVEK